MDNSNPQPPTNAQYALYSLAISLAGAVGIWLRGSLKAWWKNRHPSEADKAAILERNWNVAEKALHRMDDLQAIVRAQLAQIIELEEIKAKYDSLRPYTKRCEDRLKENKIDLPERWESSDDH